MAFDEQVFEEIDLAHVLKALMVSRLVDDMRNNMFWTMMNYVPSEVMKDPKVERFMEDLQGLINHTEIYHDFFTDLYAEVSKALGEEKMELLTEDAIKETSLGYHHKQYDKYIQESIQGNRDPFGLSASWLPDNLDSYSGHEEDEEEEVPVWKRKRQ